MLLEKVGDPERRVWYTRQAIEHDWSRNVRVHQIESGLYERQGRALRSGTAAIKGSLHLQFSELGVEAQERDLEQALLRHLREFLIDLGMGFAFVGSQFHMVVGDQDYYIAMLFYHLKLRCFVAIDLKIGEFKPEDAGKMNFYLSARADLLRHPDDQPSIGLILCKSKNQVIVEYTLRDIRKPIDVLAYQLTQALPDHLQMNLPTIEELEAALDEPDADDIDRPASR